MGIKFNHLFYNIDREFIMVIFRLFYLSLFPSLSIFIFNEAYFWCKKITYKKAYSTFCLEKEKKVSTEFV
jgi:hypothetical protein